MKGNNVKRMNGGLEIRLKIKARKQVDKKCTYHPLLKKYARI